MQFKRTLLIAHATIAKYISFHKLNYCLKPQAWWEDEIADATSRTKLFVAEEHAATALKTLYVNAAARWRLELVHHVSDIELLSTELKHKSTIELATNQTTRNNKLPHFRTVVRWEFCISVLHFVHCTTVNVARTVALTFHRLPQSMHKTNVVIGSSELRVWSWNVYKYQVLLNRWIHTVKLTRRAISETQCIELILWYLW